jgi:hypothetical protein
MKSAGILAALILCSAFIVSVRIPQAVNLATGAYPDLLKRTEMQVALLVYMLPCIPCVVSVALAAIDGGRLIAYGLHVHAFTFACLTYHDWV